MGFNGEHLILIYSLGERPTMAVRATKAWPCSPHIIALLVCGPTITSSAVLDWQSTGDKLVEQINITTWSMLASPCEQLLLPILTRYAIFAAMQPICCVAA
ncbi:hypothetical protein LJR231_006281 [Phyllobacterium sp. LjRoot231]|uniref:hypothetical protein n=1 Tax=Phyllobacterium sp. LjRoot231 TaxID=3342289 RepID=UPI003ECE4F38